MTIRANDYQQLAMSSEADQQRIRQRIYLNGLMATRLENAVRGLCDDTGELAGAVKKWLEYGQPLDIPNVEEEIGDCLWRLAQACTAIGITLEQAMESNLRKLKVRYGDGVCTPDMARESSRDRMAERQAIVDARGDVIAQTPLPVPVSGSYQFGHPSEVNPEACDHTWIVVQTPEGSGLKCGSCGAVRPN